MPTQRKRSTKAPFLEIVPWSSVRRVTGKASGHKMIRHTINKLDNSHLGLYVNSLGYIQKQDLGRRLIVDYDVNLKTIVVYIS